MAAAKTPIGRQSSMVCCREWRHNRTRIEVEAKVGDFGDWGAFRVQRAGSERRPAIQLLPAAVLRQAISRISSCRSVDRDTSTWCRNICSHCRCCRPLPCRNPYRPCRPQHPPPFSPCHLHSVRQRERRPARRPGTWRLRSQEWCESWPRTEIPPTQTRSRSGRASAWLKTFDDASFVFRQYVRQFLQMMIKIMRPDANSQDTIAFQRGSLFYRRADPTPPAISIVVEIAVDVAHVEL